VSITTIRTIGDLRDAYLMFFAGDGALQDSEELLAAERRIEARKEKRGAGR
jgi:hypothetical protein